MGGVRFKLWALRRKLRKRLGKRKREKVIDFIDLGAGRHFTRAERVASGARKGKKRRVVAVDEEAPSREVPWGMEYAHNDAVAYLKSVLKSGRRAKVINAECFIAYHALSKEPGWRSLSPRERCNEAIKKSIDPELLDNIKAVLARNGRFYSTTTKWHCEALEKKLREEGFAVTFRPLTKREIEELPPDSRKYYDSWRQGAFQHFFGKKGWELHRITAVKRT